MLLAAFFSVQLYFNSQMLTGSLIEFATGISSSGVTQGPGGHKTKVNDTAVMSSLSAKWGCKAKMEKNNENFIFLETGLVTAGYIKICSAII